VTNSVTPENVRPGESGATHHTWACPNCPWVHQAHPHYGWASHDDLAVEVHRITLCPVRVGAASTERPGGAA
jgi:hypothetical protein